MMTFGGLAKHNQAQQTGLINVANKLKMSVDRAHGGYTKSIAHSFKHEAHFDIFRLWAAKVDKSKQEVVYDFLV